MLIFFGCAILILAGQKYNNFCISLESWLCVWLYWSRMMGEDKKNIKNLQAYFPSSTRRFDGYESKRKKMTENEHGAHIFHWKIIYFDVFAWKCFIISSFIACFYAVVKRNKHIFRKTLSKNDHRIIQVE